MPAVADTLFEMDPASPPWWNDLPTCRCRACGPRSAGQRRRRCLATRFGDRSFNSVPGGREPNVSWEAFPLPIAKPGQPHVVEVEYPTDVAQTMGISIVEPNAAGRMTPIGLDTGVCVPMTQRAASPDWQNIGSSSGRRTRTPLLLVTNQREGSRAVFGKVRVIGPKAASVSNLGRDTSRPAFLPRAFPSAEPKGNRLLAAYYDRPLFPENFSANEGLRRMERSRP